MQPAPLLWRLGPARRLIDARLHKVPLGRAKLGRRRRAHPARAQPALPRRHRGGRARRLVRRRVVRLDEAHLSKAGRRGHRAEPARHRRVRLCSVRREQPRRALLARQPLRAGAGAGRRRAHLAAALVAGQAHAPLWCGALRRLAHRHGRFRLRSRRLVFLRGAVRKEEHLVRGAPAGLLLPLLRLPLGCRRGSSRRPRSGSALRKLHAARVGRQVLQQLLLQLELHGHRDRGAGGAERALVVLDEVRAPRLPADGAAAGPLDTPAAAHRRAPHRAVRLHLRRRRSPGHARHRRAVQRQVRRRVSGGREPHLRGRLLR